jgi:hypothetical protein
MQIKVDPDVRAVIEFVQTTISADRRVSVARGLAQLAPILWAETGNTIRPLSLSHQQISAHPVRLDD